MYEANSAFGLVGAKLDDCKRATRVQPLRCPGSITRGRRRTKMNNPDAMHDELKLSSCLHTAGSDCCQQLHDRAKRKRLRAGRQHQTSASTGWIALRRTPMTTAYGGAKTTDYALRPRNIGLRGDHHRHELKKQRSRKAQA